MSDEELPEEGVVYRAQPELEYGQAEVLHRAEGRAPYTFKVPNQVDWEGFCRSLQETCRRVGADWRRVLDDLAKSFDPDAPPPVDEGFGAGADYEIKLAGVADAVADFDDSPGEGAGEDSEPGPEGDPVHSDGSGSPPEPARWEAIRGRLDPANDPGGNRDAWLWDWDRDRGWEGGRNDYGFARLIDVRLAYRRTLEVFEVLDRYFERFEEGIYERLQIIEDRVLETGGQGRSGGGEDQEGGGDEGLEGHGDLLSEDEGPNYPGFQVEVNSEDLARVLLALSTLDDLELDERRSAGSLAYTVDVCRNASRIAAGVYSQPSRLHELFRND